MPLRWDLLERVTMRSSWFVVLVLAGMLVLAGCGGATDTDPAAAETPTAGATAIAAPLGATPAVAGSPGPGDAAVSADCWREDQRAPAGEAPADKQWTAPPAMTVDPTRTYRGTVQTSKGTFKVELFPKDAPLAVNNFVCLARAGYFDNTVFHRVVPGFVIQGGDPTASGRGGPGYRFPDEPITRDYATGTLAMANAGTDTNGSQFFVVLEGGATKLQKLYTIFGQVTEGMDVVEAIGQTDPRTEPITLQSVTIAEE